jgi:hypothetical protein
MVVQLVQLVMATTTTPKATACHVSLMPMPWAQTRAGTTAAVLV